MSPFEMAQICLWDEMTSRRMVLWVIVDVKVWEMMNEDRRMMGYCGCSSPLEYYC